MFSPQDIANRILTEDELREQARVSLVAEWINKSWNGDPVELFESLADLSEKQVDALLERNIVSRMLDKLKMRKRKEPGLGRDPRDETSQMSARHPLTNDILRVLGFYGDEGAGDIRKLGNVIAVINKTIKVMEQLDTNDARKLADRAGKIPAVNKTLKIMKKGYVDTRDELELIARELAEIIRKYSRRADREVQHKQRKQFP